MTSYSGRYERGQRDEVWQELQALGPMAFDAVHREDVEAVARSMALRARHNVELLVSRLSEAGFEFRSNDDERLTRPAHIPPTADAGALVDWMERTFGAIPLTVAAWIREVGDVWLVGDHPDWPDSELADPLVVEFEASAYVGEDSRDHVMSVHQAWLHTDDGSPFNLWFAPDDFHKANISGGSPYGIQLPAEAADGWCSTLDCRFVDYLNDVFIAGGFPGGIEGCDAPPSGLREGLAADLLRL